MIYLRTIRLDFLDLGPKVENLEIFEHLENLYLQHNKLNEIGHGLMHNKKLIFLALANNQIKHFEGLGHLKQLAFLDISNNLIEAIPDVREIPPNLMMLKTHGNPVSKYCSEYRKPIVLYLQKLEELACIYFMDRVKVVQAERMAYRGLIRIDVDKLIEQYRVERQEADAKERMERDLYLDFMQTKGLEYP